MKHIINQFITLAYLVGLVYIITTGADFWPFITFVVIGLFVVLLHMGSIIAQDKQKNETERAKLVHPSAASQMFFNIESSNTDGILPVNTKDVPQYGERL